MRYSTVLLLVFSIALLGVEALAQYHLATVVQLARAEETRPIKRVGKIQAWNTVYLRR